jgi:tRNA pseudouridine32 synthase/23S rRNA pseudouridine746 synthase
MLESWKEQPEGSSYRVLERSFAEGKMLGVLLVSPHSSDVYYIAAFSGTVRGADGLVTATVEGFIPPIIDLTTPDGYFKIKEAEISQLNLKIAELSDSPRLKNLKYNLTKAESERDAEIDAMQAKIRSAKKRRDELRQEVLDQNTWNELIRESQFQKAELKRHKDKWKVKIDSIKADLSLAEEEIQQLKTLRSQKSDDLQKWIFKNAEVHNAIG